MVYFPVGENKLLHYVSEVVIFVVFRNSILEERLIEQSFQINYTVKKNLSLTNYAGKYRIKRKIFICSAIAWYLYDERRTGQDYLHW